MNRRERRSRLVDFVKAAFKKSPNDNQPSASTKADDEAPASRLESVLKKQQLELSAGGVRLRASVSADLSLVISVRVTQGWDPMIEGLLYDALSRSTSELAALVLTEWPLVRDACERDSTRPAFLPKKLQRQTEMHA